MIDDVSIVTVPADVTILVVEAGEEATVVVEYVEETVVTTGEQGPQGAAGPTGTYEDEPVFAKRVDFVSDTVLYKGEAAVGSAESSPAWRIRRITFAVDGDVSEQWAGGNATFDKVWDDRATLSYT